jgi:hypothetical protein
MSLYLSIHHAPGLSNEEIGAFIPEVKKNQFAQFRHFFVNQDTGFIVTVYEGDSVEAVQSEFERIGWPYESTTEIQFALDRAGLDAMNG